MEKSIIVTGGAGFIASHLVDALIERGYVVHVIDKQKPPRSIKNPKAIYYRLDIRSSSIQKIFRRVKPEGLFHLAAHLYDRESIAKPMLSVTENIEGLVNVMEAFRAFGTGKVCFASSAAVYGNQESLPVPETAPIHPGTPYGISKFTGEQYVRFYGEHYNIPYTILRMSNVYGPRQNSSAESGVMAIFADRLLRGENVFLNNDGKTMRDYLFVEDAVQGFVKAFEREESGIYNLGTGVQTSTRAVYDAICKAVGVEREPDYREDVVDVLKANALDASRAKTSLGWAAKTGIAQGVEKTIEWYKAR
ncbi:MAG: NAD-dependent epimerase/dehydratase family protein [Patescibacteria group bacterium]|jgi:UDP-glucose 4-epimerase